MTDIQHYLSLPYTTTLKRDDEGDIVATIAELNGCVAHGSNEAEALQNLREALTGWIEAALAAGLDVPPPEIVEDLPSGKFVVRLPRSLHRKLNKLAKKDDISLNQLMVVAATDYVARIEGRTEGRTWMRRAYEHLHSLHPAPIKWDQTEATQTGKDSALLQKLKEQGMKAVEEDPNAHRERVGRK